ncbi:hypothetical protein B0H19DRAFT_1162274 [Mycena capillaripes]|nr:hypothetical protein B0H19DRAFT_1162274 [Mycena capillaripes]
MSRSQRRSKRYSTRLKDSSVGSKKRTFGNESLAKIVTKAKSRSMEDYWTRRCCISVSTWN